MKSDFSVVVQVLEAMVRDLVMSDHGWNIILSRPGRSGGDEPGLEAIRGLQHKLRVLNTRLPSSTSAHISNQVTKCTWCMSLIAFITGNSSLDHMFEGLLSQIHMDSSGRVSAEIEPGTCG